MYTDLFKPRLENIDTLRVFEVKNRYRLTREMIGELHNLKEADIAAQTDRSNPVPTMTKVFYCFYLKFNLLCSDKEIISQQC